MADVWVDEISRHKCLSNLKIRAPGAAQSGDVPRIVDGNLLPVEVAAQPLLLWREIAAYRREPHEVRGVRRATAEWPSTADPITAVNCARPADSAGGAHDK